MFFGKTGGKTEIGKLDVPTTVKKDVVWLDVSATIVSFVCAIAMIMKLRTGE